MRALDCVWPQHRKRDIRLRICRHPRGQLRRSFVPRLCRVTSRRAAGHRECATHGPQRSSQRKLAGKFPMHERFHRDLPARGQNAQRDRQVKAAGLLRQVGRGEIDGGCGEPENRNRSSAARRARVRGFRALRDRGGPRSKMRVIHWRGEPRPLLRARGQRPARDCAPRQATCFLPSDGAPAARATP